MVRVNVQLSDRDFRALSLLAERARVMPGTFARLMLVGAVDAEIVKLQAAGQLEQFPQVDLFPKQPKKRGK